MQESDTARAILRTRGRVPIFPLPNVVLFPHVTLPLHIFEPRYRTMIEEALKGDRMVAMVLLKPGWESGYDGTPEVFQIGCAGLIEDEVRLPDGRFNIRLRGLSRIEIREFVQDQPYRIASVRMLIDLNEDGGPNVEEEKRTVLGACASVLQEMSGLPSHPFALDEGLPLAAIVNALAQNLSLDTTDKQELLETGDVVLRGRRLAALLNERWRELASMKAGLVTPGDGGVH